jgi:hypothetical protein
MTATCLGVLLTMLSWSTSGMGRENANQEFKEFKEVAAYRTIASKSDTPAGGIRHRSIALDRSF